MSKSSKFHLELIEPRIIRVCLSDGIEIELEDAQAMILAAVALAEGMTYVTLFDSRPAASISKEARDAFAVSPKRIAAAILTNSIANRLVGNFFIKYHKPIYPARVFSDEQDAIKWLRLVLSENIKI